MKRILFSVLAMMFVAGSAHAATITIDTDQASYSAGDSIIIDVQYNILAGESIAAFAPGFFVQLSWDPTVAFVANAGIAGVNGQSSQNPILAGLSGSPTPTCSNSGFECTVITQSTFGGFTAAADTVINGQLILEASALGSLGLGTSVVDGPVGFNVIFGANAQAATVVPEPGTLLLLGSGIAGLAAIGRRRV